MKKEIGQCKDCRYWGGDMCDDCESEEMQASLWTSYQIENISVQNPEFGCWFWKQKIEIVPWKGD